MSRKFLGHLSLPTSKLVSFRMLPLLLMGLHDAIHILSYDQPILGARIRNVEMVAMSHEFKVVRADQVQDDERAFSSLDVIHITDTNLRHEV